MLDTVIISYWSLLNLLPYLKNPNKTTKKPHKLSKQTHYFLLSVKSISFSFIYSTQARCVSTTEIVGIALGACVMSPSHILFLQVQFGRMHFSSKWLSLKQRSWGQPGSACSCPGSRKYFGWDSLLHWEVDIAQMLHTEGCVVDVCRGSN